MYKARGRWRRPNSIFRQRKTKSSVHQVAFTQLINSEFKFQPSKTFTLHPSADCSVLAKDQNIRWEHHISQFVKLLMIVETKNVVLVFSCAVDAAAEAQCCTKPEQRNSKLHGKCLQGWDGFAAKTPVAELLLFSALLCSARRPHLTSGEERTDGTFPFAFFLERKWQALISWQQPALHVCCQIDGSMFAR